MNQSTKLTALRAQFTAQNITGFILPRSDEYLGEYVAPADERLAWLTGFTGSAGYAVITNNAAALFTDGRYTLQAQQQLSTDYQTHSNVTEKLEDWLQAQNVTGALGYDPKLHSESWREQTEKALAPLNIKLLPLTINPVDAIWPDRPAPPAAPVTTQPLKYNGKPGRTKCAEIAAELVKANCDALYINDPTLIAWLFNIRGSDVPHTPVAQCQAILRSDASAILFIDPVKCGETIQNEFEQNSLGFSSPYEEGGGALRQQSVGGGVTLSEQSQTLSPPPPSLRSAPPPSPGGGWPPLLNSSETLKAHLGCDVTMCSPSSLVQVLQEFTGKTMRTTKHNTNAWIVQQLRATNVKLEHGADLILNARAIKNTVELKGAQAAHLEDGVALVEFMSWLQETAPSGTLTELDCVAKLQELRAQHPLYRDDSFPAIVGWAAHGAIIHYRPLPETNATLSGDGLLLVDSGGQYQNGTTDVTRTIALGTPSAEQRDIYTRVLKGHIAISQVQFPVGTTGGQLDILARQALWEVGLDFAHGTGHGVGSYLSVHEGPQRISSKPDSVALAAGMILSNEPGYYRADAFGIRIENLLYVVEASNGFLKFETLTLAPYDCQLINPALLTDKERSWLMAYYIHLHELLNDKISLPAKAYLKSQLQCFT